MIWFLLGLFVGSIVGYFTAALAAVAAQADRAIESARQLSGDRDRREHRIREFENVRGRPPTVAELADLFRDDRQTDRRRPECDTCGGWGIGCYHEGRFSPQHCAQGREDCPSCHGTGVKS